MRLGHCLMRQCKCLESVLGRVLRRPEETCRRQATLIGATRKASRVSGHTLRIPEVEAAAFVFVASRT